jgi:hypothetical protein
VNPVCEYCGEESALVTGKIVYPHIPRLHANPIYACMPCRAWVGCHPSTTKPLGRLANGELRKKKMAAHASFDPLWKEGRMKRKEAYAWLAGKLGIAVKDTHIGMFDAATCDRVVKACQELEETP